MADDGDLAQIEADQHLMVSMINMRYRRPSGAGKTHCEDCGQPIPEARRLAAPGCERCTLCQTELEKTEK